MITFGPSKMHQSIFIVIHLRWFLSGSLQKFNHLAQNLFVESRVSIVNEFTLWHWDSKGSGGSGPRPAPFGDRKFVD